MPSHSRADEPPLSTSTLIKTNREQGFTRVHSRFANCPSSPIPFFHHGKKEPDSLGVEDKRVM